MLESSLDTSIVKKPWGYEYLYYQNDFVGVWLLHLEKDHVTSMHCHPNKNTGLILLDGSVEVSFLTSSQILTSPHKLMIRRGLFHSTKAISDNGAFLFEIEAPKDKRDLVRISDSYGRAKTPYESSDQFYGNTCDFDLLDSNVNGDFKLSCSKHTFCLLRYVDLKDITHSPSCILVNLSGGLEADPSIYVYQPGDVVSGFTANLLQSQFNYTPDTLVLRLT